MNKQATFSDRGTGTREYCSQKVRNCFCAEGMCLMSILRYLEYNIFERPLPAL